LDQLSLPSYSLTGRERYGLLRQLRELVMLLLMEFDLLGRFSL